jgi:parvulin-like peptidyl-prolyl isomerase
MSLNANAKRVLKIVAALMLSLAGLALLPLVALPYGGLDWLQYDQAYKNGYGCVSSAKQVPQAPAYVPTPVPKAPTPAPRVPTPAVQEIPCVELPEPGEPLAAVINGQGIGQHTFDREMTQYLDSLEALGQGPEGEDLQSELPILRRQVLDLLIDDVLVQQAAVGMGISVPDQEIQDRVAQEVTAAGGLEAFQAWLDRTGQTWEEFRREVCQDLLRQAVFVQATGGITGTMEMVHAREITVATLEDAVAVLTRLASGEDFAQVAREVSLDDQTRALGGDLGWFPRNADWLPPEIVAAAFAGASGQVQEPIRVGDNYVIVQTIERQADHPLDPDTLEALRASAFERWLAERRRGSQIEILIDLDAQ